MLFRKIVAQIFFNVFLVVVLPIVLNAKNIDLNKGWKFYFAYDVRRQPDTELVDLPHTWNAKDVLQEKIHYKRDAAVYEKQLSWNDSWRGKRLFLHFAGANSVASVFVNKQLAGEHIGGYTAFCIEITDLVKAGEINQITVWVSNAFRWDVAPLSGDFNIYGGLHRSVSLLVKDQNCISPLDFASSGVYVQTPFVTEKAACITLETKLSLRGQSDKLSLRTSLLDAKGKTVKQLKSAVAFGQVSLNQSFDFKQPHLWNGKTDPYLYKIKCELLENGLPIDIVEQPLGFRFFSVDANNGFFLNGKPYDLHGVGIHEDVLGKGSAMLTEDRKKDHALIQELGATALRLTHYPHDQQMYEFADREGLVLWTEIPLVGPGGYTGTGYIPSKNFERNAEQQLQELIHQNYNHPSVFFWGLFNELKLDYGDPIPFLQHLNSLAKELDPGRLTVCASFLDNDRFNSTSDLIAWNKYYGWYDGIPADLGNWADKTHASFPAKPIAVSEYGAGGSPFKHSEVLTKPVTTDRFHPEEWQTYFHEKNWEQLQTRPFLWGKFIWVFADFGSSIRSEGDVIGVNDKGLITYDRAIKKDAFYFYKANWNSEPTLYLTEKRNTERSAPICTIKVYSNLKNVVLKVNGKEFRALDPDKFHTLKWENVALNLGKNVIKVTAVSSGKLIEDTCVWIRKADQ